MKTIDRYVYAVTERLPENIREDIKKELYANIEDMLPENYTEDDVRRVLEKLGDPVKLANEYSQTKRYLIGPDMYDSYISVLKLVTFILAIVLVLVTSLGIAINPPISGSFIELSIKLITNTIVSVIQGIVQGCLWVTLVFVILERTGVNEGKIPFIKKKWSVDDLADISLQKGSKISRFETAFGMFFTMLFLIVFYFQPQAIGIYTFRENGITLLEPLLMIDKLQTYMPAIILIAFLGFGIQIWKFISMKWNVPLAVANTINNLAVCTLVLIMLGDSSLLNQNFIPGIANITRIPLNQISNAWNVGVRISIALFIITVLWDIISGFINARKH